MQNVEPLNEDDFLKHNAMLAGQAKQLESASKELLACWQIGWKQDSAKWLSAEKEWQRRFVKEASISQREAALIGVFGAILGVLVGALLTFI
jgi:hypothetical protein